MHEIWLSNHFYSTATKRKKARAIGCTGLLSLPCLLFIKFLNEKMLLIVIVAQALLESCLHLSPRLSSTAQRKCFSADIAANDYFGSLGF